MKKKLSLYLLFSFNICSLTANNLQLTVASNNHAKMPFAILLPHSASALSQEFATTIKKDLMFIDQFAPTIIPIHNTISKQDLAKTITKTSSQNIPFALHIRMEPDNSITWRLYDTFQGTALKQKKYKPKNNVVRSWGHKVADEIVHALTGNSGFFSSRIAYCKEQKIAQNNVIKHIYIADYDGSNPELLVNMPTISVAPRWDINKYNPRILYSEYTDTNVQLMSIDMQKNTTVCSNLDGVNMLASFSPNGEKSVFCASKGKGSCQIMYQTKDALRNLTNNTGNNDTPMFIDNDHICFCSDAQTKSPQIYIGNLTTGHIQRITKGGYCTSPNYCKTNNIIAYHMKVNNIMQIYTYDCSSKTHTQITHDNTNKHGVSWSPDGTYLLFTKEQDGKSHIASLNLSTKKTHRLTSLTDICSYPNWSPQYDMFPTIRT